jgi:hypothetical protein
MFRYYHILKNCRRRSRVTRRPDYIKAAIDGNHLLIYDYTLKDGSSSSIMYAQKVGSTKSGGFEIDCTGDCDCREQYHFDTNTSSCTCSPCKMKVTPIEE